MFDISPDADENPNEASEDDSNPSTKDKVAASRSQDDSTSSDGCPSENDRIGETRAESISTRGSSTISSVSSSTPPDSLEVPSDHEDGIDDALEASSEFDEDETNAEEADRNHPKEVGNFISDAHDDETSYNNHHDPMTTEVSRSNDICTPRYTENLSSTLKRNSDNDDTSVQPLSKLPRTTEFDGEALIATTAKAERLNQETLSTVFAGRSKTKSIGDYMAFRLLQYAYDIASDSILGEIRDSIWRRCTQIKVPDNMDQHALKNLHEKLKNAEAKVHVEIAKIRWMKVQYYVIHSHHVKEVQKMLDDSRQEKKSKGFHLNCQWPEKYQDLEEFHVPGRKASDIIKRWAVATGVSERTHDRYVQEGQAMQKATGDRPHLLLLYPTGTRNPRLKVEIPRYKALRKYISLEHLSTGESQMLLDFVSALKPELCDIEKRLLNNVLSTNFADSDHALLDQQLRLLQKNDLQDVRAWSHMSTGHVT